MDEWDRKPKEPASVWLKLKTKGEMAKFRIAAAPMREPIIWPSEPGGRPIDPEVVADFTSGQWMSIMRSPDWEIREAYILLVIDRADGLAKIFRCSGSVYGKIRDYAKNPEWGNPTEYDFTITRTEAPGKAYWDVTPSPTKSSLMTSEVDKVRQLDVAKLLPNALPTNVPQPDDIDDNVAPERLPWEAAPVPTVAAAPSPKPVASPITPDVVIEDLDEPISLDDIPFNDDPGTSQKGRK